MNPITYEIDWQKEIGKINDHRDANAFKLLFHHFYTDLLSFSTAISNHQEASEDIIAELMLKIWQQPEKLLGVKNLKTYLFISTRNLTLNYLEKNKVRDNYILSNPEITQQDYNPEDQLVSKEIIQKINQAIEQLPPKTKMAFTLVKDNDCSYAEAADIMEISIKTVDRHLQIALAKIRDFLNR